MQTRRAKDNQEPVVICGSPSSPVSCHEVGRGECPRLVSRSHDYTATSRSFIIPAMRGGRQRDLSLCGKIAKPLFEGVSPGSVAASGLPPKDQDTPESPGSVRIPRPAADFINSSALPTLSQNRVTVSNQLL